MLTNNFYQAMRAFLTNSTMQITTLANTTGNYSITSDKSYYIFRGFANNDSRYVVKTAAANETWGMAFGTGTVPPTPADYWLSGNVITTLNIVACTVTSNNGDGFLRMINDVTVKNTSDTETVVINEMGVIGQSYYGSSTKYACLVDRTVLDTPLTLAPGEQGVITYTFNLPIVQ